MRESIGGTWLLGIVMVFVVLLASFLAVSINYSKVFKVKNNIVDLIEKNEGMSEKTVEEIYSYLLTEGYILKGTCADGYKGFDKNDDVASGEKALYCVKRIKVNSDTGTTLEKAYYSVNVFFKFDLPVIGEFLTFKLSGETMTINFPNDDPSYGLNTTI